MSAASSEAEYDPKNLFARILAGEINAHRVYDDDHAIAILDVMPQGKGHTLVLPKTPSRNILDIGAHDLQALALAVQKVARALVKAFDAQGVTIMNYSEPAGGQSIFHTHVHVIPRFKGVALNRHGGAKADPEKLADQAFRIRSALGGLG